jgi:Ca-activated chloride channel homolog
LYIFSDSDQKLAVKSVHLGAKVFGSIASITLTQMFVNNTNNNIECLYKFPMSNEFSVTGVKIKAGEKTIEAEIMEKKKAKEKFDDSVAAGHTAVQVQHDEELPEVI